MKEQPEPTTEIDKDTWYLWAPILLAKVLKKDLRAAIRKLSIKECRYMAAYVEEMVGPVNAMLRAWGLPETAGQGFWHEEVLPLLKNRLRSPEPCSDGSGPSAPFGLRERFQYAKAAVSIVEIASRYTLLRPAGAGKWKGPCPLHTEKTPSFKVDDGRQTWRCFGACGRGGDVIELARLLMEAGRW